MKNKTQNLTRKMVDFIYSSLINKSPYKFIKQILWFKKQYSNYTTLTQNNKFKDIVYYPCLDDNTETTKLDPVYFFQDTWLAKNLHKYKPQNHVDIGSSAKTIGLISQFIPTTMVDIRPLELKLDGLKFIEGSILELPFEDNSIESISSICVVEHIGLGRYGDPLDQFGSEKAIIELKRVVKPNGYIYISVPVDEKCKTHFNAHRAFTREQVIQEFHGLELIEEKYQYGDYLYNSYDSQKGFGTGLFMFKK